MVKKKRRAKKKERKKKRRKEKRLTAQYRMALPMIPAFVGIGTIICGAIMMGLWVHYGQVSGVYNAVPNCSASSDAGCAFIVSYVLAACGAGVAIIGGILVMIYGFSGGESGGLRAGAFGSLLFASILCVTTFAMWWASVYVLASGSFIVLTAYESAMIAFAFITFAIALANAILSCVFRG
jgi:hypothetical protein